VAHEARVARLKGHGHDVQSVRIDGLVEVPVLTGGELELFTELPLDGRDAQPRHGGLGRRRLGEVDKVDLEVATNRALLVKPEAQTRLSRLEARLRLVR
jgi:hypothetical protein